MGGERHTLVLAVELSANLMRAECTAAQLEQELIPFVLSRTTQEADLLQQYVPGSRPTATRQRAQKQQKLKQLTGQLLAEVGAEGATFQRFLRKKYGCRMEWVVDVIRRLEQEDARSVQDVQLVFFLSGLQTATTSSTSSQINCSSAPPEGASASTISRLTALSNGRTPSCTSSTSYASSEVLDTTRTGELFERASSCDVAPQQLDAHTMRIDKVDAAQIEAHLATAQASIGSTGAPKPLWTALQHMSCITARNVDHSGGKMLKFHNKRNITPTGRTTKAKVNPYALNTAHHHSAGRGEQEDNQPRLLIISTQGRSTCLDPERLSLGAHFVQTYFSSVSVLVLEPEETSFGSERLQSLERFTEKLGGMCLHVRSREEISDMIPCLRMFLMHGNTSLINERKRYYVLKQQQRLLPTSPRRMQSTIAELVQDYLMLSSGGDHDELELVDYYEGTTSR
ncbi:unnamed protein product, partial [Amoebophrya sp. A25]|eukprot:GSA25T00010676001.1